MEKSVVYFGSTLKGGGKVLLQRNCSLLFSFFLSFTRGCWGTVIAEEEEEEEEGVDPSLPRHSHTALRQSTLRPLHPAHLLQRFTRAFTRATRGVAASPYPELSKRRRLKRGLKGDWHSQANLRPFPFFFLPEILGESYSRNFNSKSTFTFDFDRLERKRNSRDKFISSILGWVESEGSRRWCCYTNNLLQPPRPHAIASGIRSNWPGSRTSQSDESGRNRFSSNDKKKNRRFERVIVGPMPRSILIPIRVIFGKF